jgi:hypothetical protein
MSHKVTVVRCPSCGSTDAGEVDGSYEFSQMRCAACGHTELCDEYQIKDVWNLTIELPDDAVAPPAMLPPKRSQ